MDAPELSVVLPLYRNAATVGELVRRLAAALEGRRWELVGVDDGGGDDTAHRLLSAARRAGVPVRLVRHPANLGQNAAVLSGLAASRGDTVVVMDADLQDPPEAVPRLVEALERERAGLAFGVRTGRWTGPLEILSGRAFKAVLFRLLGSRLPARVGLFVAMRLEVRDALLERARPGDYLLAHLAALDEPAALVPFPRVPRPGGGTGYGLRRRLALARRALALGWRLRRRPFPPALAVGSGLLAAAIGALQAISRPFGLQDDGFRWLLSAWWARGEPILDRVQLLYPFGQYAWFGAWIAALGERIASLRLAQGALCGLAAALLAPGVARAAGTRAAWALAVLLGAAGTGSEKLPAFAAVAAAALALERAGERVALTGLGAGLLLPWREDAAVLLMALAAAAALLPPGPRIRRGAVAAAGFAAGTGLWAAVAAAHGQLGPAVDHQAWRLALLLERLTPGGRTAMPVAPPTAVASPRDLAALAVPALRVAVPLAELALLAWGLRRWRRGLASPAPALAAAAALALAPHFVWEMPDLAHLREHLPVAAVAVAVAGGSVRRLRRLVAPALLAVAAAAAGLLALQRAMEPAVPYPAGHGRSLGVRLVEGAPPWAGLPRRPGETAIALPWCPGWYAVEGLPPGTRFLSALPRHRDLPGLEDTLAADLARPANRWVILGPASRGDGAGTLPAAARAALRRHYRPLARWAGYVLWERAASRP